MSAQVIALRPPRRPSSDPHARLLDLEAEVSEQLAIGRRVGQRLNELEAERTQIEQALREQDQLRPFPYEGRP